MSIPANEIVSVTPSVLSAGGNPLALNGLILTEAACLPIGAPMPFPSASAVNDYFGPASTEYAMAAIYFNGFENSNMKPSSILFSRYASAPVGAFLRGAQSSLTLAQIKSIATTNLMTVMVDGSVATCSNVDLSGATSPSNAAQLITSAFSGTTAPVVTYDSQFEAFVLTSGTTGVLSTIDYAAEALATTLNLTAVKGAVLSQGADTTTPGAHMAAVPAFTQNWVDFATTFEPITEDKKAFANWTALTGGRYMYVAWDTDVVATQTPGEANQSFGAYLKLNDIGGVVPIYADADNGPLHAAFILGTTASIDFTETNGRITYAFKSGSSLLPAVTDDSISVNLLGNGYNFYGSYATANDNFTWFYNGQISGAYSWADSYINAVWLNNQLQLAMMTLFANTKSVPYNPLGYGLIRAAAQDPIDAAVNFGAMRGGVPLSALQAAEVNAASGTVIDQVLASRGWYFQVLPASAQVRGLRQSPPCTLWYMDGGSVHQLNIASVDIQ